MTSLGNQIQDAREKMHMTQAELANALGVSREDIAAWESGDRTPDRKQLSALGDKLDTVFFDARSAEAQMKADEKLEQVKAAEFKNQGGGLFGNKNGAENGRGKSLWMIPLVLSLVLAGVLLLVLQSSMSGVNKQVDELKNALITTEGDVDTAKGQIGELQSADAAISDKITEMDAANASANETMAAVSADVSDLKKLNASRGVSFSTSGTQVSVYPLQGSTLTITPPTTVEGTIRVTHTGYNMAEIKRKEWSYSKDPNLAVAFTSDKRMTIDGTAEVTVSMNLNPTKAPTVNSPVLFTLYAGKTYYISACRLVYFDEEGTAHYIAAGQNTPSAKNAVPYTPEQDIQVRGIQFRIVKDQTYTKKVVWQPYVGIIQPTEWVQYRGKTYSWDAAKGAFTVYALDGLNMVFTDTGDKVRVKGSKTVSVEQSAQTETPDAEESDVFLGRYAFSSTYRKRNGYYKIQTGWTSDTAYNTYVFPVEPGAAYFYSPNSVSLVGLDEDKAIVETLTKTQQENTKGYVYTAVNCKGIKYVAYPVEKDNDAATPTLWYSNHLFETGAVLPAGSGELSVSFSRDQITYPAAARSMGTFSSGTYNAKGLFSESDTYYSTKFMVFEKGTLLDASNTGIKLRIRGTNSNGYLYKASYHYVFPQDTYATVNYQVLEDGWKWSEAVTEAAPENLSYFIRWQTADEIASNPWRKKTWYSYGTGISDIALNDEEGNNGHSGKWPLYVDAVSGMTRVNGAIGGGGIMPAQSHGGNVKEAILQTPADADLVTLELLTNDDLTNLGEIGDVGDDTFLGNLTQCLNYLTTKTRAKVVFIALSETAADAALSAQRLQYRAAVEKVKQLCALFGVPVIDADANAMTTAQADFKGAQVNPIYTYLGGEIYGRYIWSQLRQIAPNFTLSAQEEAAEAEETAAEPLPEDTAEPAPEDTAEPEASPAPTEEATNGPDENPTETPAADAAAAPAPTAPEETAQPETEAADAPAA